MREFQGVVYPEGDLASYLEYLDKITGTKEELDTEGREMKEKILTTVGGNITSSSGKTYGM